MTQRRTKAQQKRFQEQLKKDQDEFRKRYAAELVHEVQFLLREALSRLGRAAQQWEHDVYSEEFNRLKDAEKFLEFALNDKLIDLEVPHTDWLWKIKQEHKKRLDMLIKVGA